MIPSSVTYSTTGAVIMAGAPVPMIALRPLFGDYALSVDAPQVSRTVTPGMKFYTNEEYARSLESRGLAERYFDPIPVPAPVIAPKQYAAPENKMLAPVENKAEAPDAKPARRPAGRPRKR